MNIKKALKEKNKKIKEANEYFSKMSQYNSVEVGNKRPYSAKEMLEMWKQSVDDLITLKTKIHLANVSVYGKIFRLAELKSMVSNLKSLSCNEGKSAPNRWSSEERQVMEAEITVTERDEMIKTLETEIEKIQDELDIHNGTTEI